MEAEQLEIDWTRKASRDPAYLQRLSVRERPHGRPVMRQRWSDLLFLHWPVDPAVLKARLPHQLQIDTFEGKAWLGIVPFAMQRVHPVGLPPLPWISWFLELNVRTYVHDAAGRPGVWFFSLDCNQPIAVEVARRFFHLPYNHAKMAREFQSGEILYSSRRAGCGGTSRFRYRPPIQAEPAREHSLEWFLVERYLLYTTDAEGRLRSGRVHHKPYRIQEADCSEWTAEPIRENGFTGPGGPPVSMLAAEPVDVTIFPLEGPQK
jgi:uncharacterized protein YqjF (DUF2071 family)